MLIQSTNPSTGETLQTFHSLTSEQVEEKISLAHNVYKKWKVSSFSERSEKLKNLANILREQKNELAKLISLEMGRVFTDSVLEVEKCAWCCDFYAENAERILADEEVETQNTESFVQFEGLGVLLAVMPWNFPYWQLIRFAAPTIMGGNTVLLKHASNVPQCALALERIFLEAGFEEGIFQTLLIGSDIVEPIIADKRVRGVTLTGSEFAGRKVAQAAGKYLKKSVLELSGNNPFLILDDADIDLTCEMSIFGRFQNCGQSCIAAKRFLVTEKNAHEFIQKFTEKTKQIVVGDPFKTGVTMGPMVDAKALNTIHEMVEKCINMGAKLLCGGKRIGKTGSFYEPTIVSHVTKKMPLYHEEAFGPVAAIIICQNEEELIEVANDSDFGLGASIFSKDIERAKKIIPQLESSALFINGFVKSDPRLPFGGVKNSGYGRELSHYALKEFVNIKTICVQ